MGVFKLMKVVDIATFDRVNQELKITLELLAAYKAAVETLQKENLRLNDIINKELQCFGYDEEII